MRFLRSWGVSLGMSLFLVAAFFVAISSRPDEAEAGCSSSSVCSTTRVRRCSMVNRCTPQRTCVSHRGVTSCVSRDVCRRVEVCA